jgi:hypothetical protein
MPKEKKTAKVEVRLAPTLAAAAKAKADKADRPLSDIIRELLQRWVTGKPSARA